MSKIDEVDKSDDNNTRRLWRRESFSNLRIFAVIYDFFVIWEGFGVEAQ